MAAAKCRCSVNQLCRSPGFAAEVSDTLLRTGYLMTGDARDAEDLVQETFLRVARRWNRVRSMDHPAAYARRILINLVLQDAERRFRQKAELAQQHAGIDAADQRAARALRHAAACPVHQRRGGSSDRAHSAHGVIASGMGGAAATFRCGPRLTGTPGWAATHRKVFSGSHGTHWRPGRSAQMGLVSWSAGRGHSPPWLSQHERTSRVKEADRDGSGGRRAGLPRHRI
jgi:Sigma-70 region 2